MKLSLDYGLAKRQAWLLLDRQDWLHEWVWRRRLSSHLPPVYYARRYCKATGRDSSSPGYAAFVERSIARLVEGMVKRGEIERDGDNVRLTDKGQKAKAQTLRLMAEAKGFPHYNLPMAAEPRGRKKGKS